MLYEFTNNGLDFTHSHIDTMCNQFYARDTINSYIDIKLHEVNISQTSEPYTVCINHICDSSVPESHLNDLDNRSEQYHENIQDIAVNIDHIDSIHDEYNYMNCHRRGILEYKILKRDRPINDLKFETTDLSFTNDEEFLHLSKPLGISDSLIPQNANIIATIQPTILMLSIIITIIINSISYYSSFNSMEYLSRKQSCDGIEHSKWVGLWINIRSEPVIYLDGKPFVVRDMNSPTEALLHEPESCAIIETREKRLVEEILKEISDTSNDTNCYGIMLHDIDPSNHSSIVSYWKKIDSISVQTSQEFFESRLGGIMHYHRIPVCLNNDASSKMFLDFITRTFIPLVDSGTQITTVIQGEGLHRDASVLFSMSAIGLVYTLGHLYPTHTNEPLYPDDKKDCTLKEFLKILYQQNEYLIPMKKDDLLQWINENHLDLDFCNSISGHFDILEYLYARLVVENESKLPLDSVLSSICYGTRMQQENFPINIVINRILYHFTKHSQYLERAKRSLYLYMLLIVYGSFLLGECNQPRNLFDSSKTIFNSHKQPFSSWLTYRTDISMLWRLVQHSFSITEILEPIGNLPEFSFSTNAKDSPLIPPRQHVSLFLAIRHDSVHSNHFSFKKSLSNIVNNESDALQSCIVENFRFDSLIPIFAMDQPQKCSLLPILEHILKKERKVLWINLREEPCLYVNDEIFITSSILDRLEFLQSDSDIHTEQVGSSFGGLRGDLGTLVEDRTAKYLRSELSNNNSILVTDYYQDGIPKRSWIYPSYTIYNGNHTAIINTTIQTTLDLFNTLPESTSKSAHYSRVPISKSTPPSLQDFDLILQAIVSSLDNANQSSIQPPALLFTSSVGLFRSSIGMIIGIMIWLWIRNIDSNSCITSDYKICSLFSYGPPSTEIFDYKVIKSLLRVLPHGETAKSMVDALIDRVASNLDPYFNQTDKFDQATHNILSAIDIFRRESELRPPGMAKDNLIRKGITNLNVYFLLISFQVYLYLWRIEPSKKLSLNMPSFSSWFESRGELSYMMKQYFNQSKLDPNVIVPEAYGDAYGNYGSNENDFDCHIYDANQILQNRKGQVLSSHTLLKADHFPGLNILESELKGVPNYRTVMLAYEDIPDVDILVAGSFPRSQDELYERLYTDYSSITTEKKNIMTIYGVGIPTVSGMKKLLGILHSNASSACKLNWVSLREEPVLYINGKPYVLRTINHPIRNIITTGISRRDLEEAESRLCNDVLNEIVETNRKRQPPLLLLHDECPNTGRIIPIWEPCTDPKNNIQTPIALFEALNKSDIYSRIYYHRIPLTDEHPPTPENFDDLLRLLLPLTPGIDHVVFNCQMGQGRTTTGMIVTVLVHIIHHKAKLVRGSCSYAANIPIVIPAVKVLVDLLEYGTLSLVLADLCIDHCDQIQNLRTHVNKFLIKMSKFNDMDSTCNTKTSHSDNEDDSHKRLCKEYLEYYEDACCYISRYCYLIAFTDYLLHIARYPNPCHFVTFSEWLEQRPPIRDILKYPVALHGLPNPVHL